MRTICYVCYYHVHCKASTCLNTGHKCPLISGMLSSCICAHNLKALCSCWCLTYPESMAFQATISGSNNATKTRFYNVIILVVHAYKHASNNDTRPESLLPSIKLYCLTYLDRNCSFCDCLSLPYKREINILISRMEILTYICRSLVSCSSIPLNTFSVVGMFKISHTYL